MIPALATPPTIQLQNPPMLPREPPPINWKVESIGAMVRPLAMAQATPRQTRSPASVTMKEGTPT